MTKQDKIRSVVDYIANRPYGETITHDEIAEISETKKDTRDYWYLMSKVQKKLVDHGHIVTNVRGIGYRVVDPDDYSAVSVNHAVKGAKLIDKGVKVLRNAPLSDMSDIGRQRYNTVNDRMVILQAAVTGAKVEITMLESKRPHPLAQIGR